MVDSPMEGALVTCQSVIFLLPGSSNAAGYECAQMQPTIFETMYFDETNLRFADPLQTKNSCANRDLLKH